MADLREVQDNFIEKIKKAQKQLDFIKWHIDNQYERFYQQDRLLLYITKAIDDLYQEHSEQANGLFEQIRKRCGKEINDSWKITVELKSGFVESDDNRDMRYLAERFHIHIGMTGTTIKINGLERRVVVDQSAEVFIECVSDVYIQYQLYKIKTFNENYTERELVYQSECSLIGDRKYV